MTLEEVISNVPQGFNWLLRSIHGEGVFAHIFTNSFIVTNGAQGRSYRSTKPSAADALQTCIEAQARKER